MTEDKLPNSWKFYKAKEPKAKDQIDMENSTCLVESLILLANNDLLLKRMNEIKLQELLPHIVILDTHEDTKLRVQVLIAQMVAKAAETAAENPPEAAAPK